MKTRYAPSHPSTTFVILHGLDGSPAGHWQCWLRDELVDRGCRVIFPELPEKRRPNLITWSDELHPILTAAGPGSTVIAHSLGALLWLHYASVPLAVRMGRVLLVAPPGKSELSQTSRVIGHRVLPLDRQLIARSAGEILMAGSEADPYCENGFVAEYANPLGLASLKLPDRAGHVNLDSGHGPWPFALRWCGVDHLPRRTHSPLIAPLRTDRAFAYLRASTPSQPHLIHEW